MIDPQNVPDVDDDEMLARYIVAGQSSKSLRKYVRENNTVSRNDIEIVTMTKSGTSGEP